ncbi:polysaccharide biosynthesis/export family protein [Bosea vaviloviae]|jgi:polysaccharide export outer membrane protein|uniref:Sugar ABC transporter substrate-binding protein n=1 Tax=Bosea vaviloviae TaxID=1526658 RepID=A0A0N1F715_9HYPH|nr:polysaccharide biosynthesis/export family protein [Bosea vaviloviae]KPH81474.1 sugar ABC transporter substrate-binding protein [Bosea vaviloviae]
MIDLKSLAVAAVLASLLGACSTLPSSGPTAASLRDDDASTDAVPFALVNLNQTTVDVLGRYEPKGLAGAFTDRRPSANIKFGIGDVVTVTIFEAAAGGLFIPNEAGVRPGNFVTLPEQAIDSDGNISVPFAGSIPAAGKTNVEVQRTIVDRIKNRAIEPQVIVALGQQRTGLVTVLGEVNNPVRFPAPASGAGDKITDAITRAGGIKAQGYESWVVLERGGKRATVPFENLIAQPVNNIYLQPNDRIYVYREAQKFLAFGAAGQQGEFNFDAWRITLANAVAKAGGLLDSQADPGSVFLYRRESRDVARRLGIDVTKFTGDQIPVIYSTDLRDPSGFFVASKMQMRNGDVIFVANAQSVQVTKFLQILNLALSTTNGAVSTGNNALILRYNIRNLSSASPIGL